MIALARKYRPRRFEDLLVQDHVAAALRGAVARSRVGHGYLLTGPRGVGKTTAARILAMALNCERRDPAAPTGEPCGDCPSCDRIWGGSASLDVVEIDAGSNRVVDDARDLRERAMYYVPKENLPHALRNRLVRLAAFQNPEFYRAQAMRLPTYDKPRIIHCAEDHAKHIGLPRGCLDDVSDLLDSLKIELVLRDERCPGTGLDVSFQGELRPEQLAAAEAMLRHETGVLSATTAFGKTVLAAWLIARRGVNALVLVHRQQLLEQWVERFSTFLGLPAKEIGRLGGGRKKLTGNVDVALLQSLVRKGEVNDCVANYGHVVVDECHHLSAHSFELVARRAKAKFFTGLSATVARKEGHQPIIFMQCGPVRHSVDAREYLGRVFNEIKPRPVYVVEQVLGGEASGGPSRPR